MLGRSKLNLVRTLLCNRSSLDCVTGFAAGTTDLLRPRARFRTGRNDRENGFLQTIDAYSFPAG